MTGKAPPFPDPLMVIDPRQRFAVIIPHYNDLVRLERCLVALEGQDREDVEVVVADNASPVDLAPLVERFGWVRVVIQPEAGAGLARNAGVAATSASWLFFVDADCVPAPDWLVQARRIAAGDPGTVTGGRVDVFDETPPPRSGAEAFETVFAFDQQGYIERKGFSVTANLVAARTTFEAVGPFLAGVSEDLDWCRRATGAGYRLAYDPGLRVAHPTRSDWPALSRKWRRLTAESFALRGAGARARLGWALRALAMPASVLWHLPRLLRHPGLSAGERLKGALTLFRLRFARMVWMLGQAVSGR
jgi:GT2 family glycosyltransferase